MAHESHHGRTPPRLIEDLIRYNPSHPGPNRICDPPKRSLDPSPPHIHDLVQIDQLTNFPPSSHSSSKEPYQVASICQSCRMHITVIIDSNKRRTETRNSLCPVAHERLHHLVYRWKKSEPAEKTKCWEDKRVFWCSSPECPAEVTVVTRPAYIDDRFTSLLTDKARLRERMKRANEIAGSEGEKQLPSFQTDELPGKAVETLLAYFRNTLNGELRPIPRKNARYLRMLSDDCRLIFEMAGYGEFKDEAGNLNWKQPLAENHELDIEGLEVFQRCSFMPQVAMMFAEASVIHSKLTQVSQSRWKGVSSLNNLSDMLGCQPYLKTKLKIRDLTSPEPSAYAGLGIVQDFSDDLVEWAYRRERDTDWRNAPYLLECLDWIAKNRYSSELQILVAMCRSQGDFTLGDANLAAKRLGLPSGWQSADEELIIGMFKSRLQDSPAQEHSMREDLKMIGQYRNSQAILDVATQVSFANIRTAYNWLGFPSNVDFRDIADETIQEMYQFKLSEEPASTEKTQAALRAIAENRNSFLLQASLEAGGNQDNLPSVADAYKTYDTTRDAEISDEYLCNMFSVHTMDYPGRLREFRDALRVIGNDRNSEQILSFLTTNPQEPETSSGGGRRDCPVGIENIGNTCYLNSLLQFYFTIKPLRDMILSVEQYEEGEVTEEVLERKRVGGRKVTRGEVERAKEFVAQLRTLFNDMITTPLSAVTPERRLAQMSLESPKEEIERRKSMSSPEATRPLVLDDDRMEIDTEDPLAAPSVTTSDATLVDDLDGPPPYVPGDTGDFVMIDADKKEPLAQLENIAPLEDGNTPNNQPIDFDAPLTPPPDRPPPIPPRPEVKKTQSESAMMFGRQQDVTECIGNVINQISYAIKPTSFEKDGEQIDLVKDLFYGKTKQTLTSSDASGSSSSRFKEELFSHLIINVADTEKDLYSALDSYFDLETISLENKSTDRYVSITKLPPILQIQVQRVQFDREKGTTWKSNAHLSFSETIFMDRYLDFADQPQLKLRREESWSWKQQLAKLTKRRSELQKTIAGPDVPTVLDATRELIEDLSSIDPELSIPGSFDISSSLSHRAESIRAEITQIDADIKTLESRVAQQFTDLRQHGYRIHSVFIHRGSVSFGHYWIYIYDFKGERWRKYNDQYVTEVGTLEEVWGREEGERGQPATPYFLVFVKDDQAMMLTEAVNRQIVEQQLERIQQPLQKSVFEDDSISIEPLA